MEPQPLEQVVRNIDERLGRVEQILPTLATKVELHDVIAPLATKADLREAIAEAIAPLATRVELREAIAEAVAPLATKVELREAIAEAVAPLATKEAIALLATKVEVGEAIREEGERTRQHFDVVAERLEGQIRVIAEGSLSERLDDVRTALKADITQLDRRVTRLEAGRTV